MTLTGLGSPTFDLALQAIRDVHGFFDRAFKAGRLQPSEALVLDRATGHTHLHASNRFLTPRKEAPDMEALALDDGVDPNNFLRQALNSGKFFHGEDNQVEYYACELNEGGKKE